MLQACLGVADAIQAEAASGAAIDGLGAAGHQAVEVDGAGIVRQQLQLLVEIGVGQRRAVGDQEVDAALALSTGIGVSAAGDQAVAAAADRDGAGYRVSP